MVGGTGARVPLTDLTVVPEKGRFSYSAYNSTDDLGVCYNFGLLSEIGAGGYNTSILSELALPADVVSITGGNSVDLDNAFLAIGGDKTIEIADSLTYAGPMKSLTVPNGATVALTALSGQRPVFRWAGAAPQSWTITGEAADTGKSTELILEGILLQGADLVLKGAFDKVTLRMMTLDPGNVYTPPPPPQLSPIPQPLYDAAIDGMPLRPSTLIIEGNVGELILERSITGSIRSRNGGAIIEMTATDSIIQSIATHVVDPIGPIVHPILFDPANLGASLKNGTNALALAATSGSASLQEKLKKFNVHSAPTAKLVAEMTAAIAQFTQAQAERVWPLALADLALGFSEGTVTLSRCTVLGPTCTHRLNASECILDNVATVEDTQAGCVRFTAYAAGSTLHEPFRSVEIAPGATIFESRRFGQPEYVKLRSDADARILSADSGGSGCCCAPMGVTNPGTILAGAENGSEMGVYCREVIPLKRRGLALKFEEYAPIGQLPVWIDVN
jgi:hypothetical protein